MRSAACNLSSSLYAGMNARLGGTAWHGTDSGHFMWGRIKYYQKEHRTEPSVAHIASPCISVWGDPS